VAAGCLMMMVLAGVSENTEITGLVFASKLECTMAAPMNKEMDKIFTSFMV
jgi:hypothetical protein